MKKIIGCLSMALALTFMSASTHAQNEDRMARMKATLTQELKDSLQLSDAVADSAASIQMDFQSKLRPIFMNQDLSQDDKQAQMKTLNDDRITKLKAFLTDDQIAKFDAIEQRRRQQMRARFGNGGGGGGNGK